MTAHPSDLDRYLQILAGANPAGRLIEIRWTIPNGMAQTFVSATRPDLAARRSPGSPPAPTSTSASCCATAAPAVATPASARTSRSSRSTHPTACSGCSATAAPESRDRLRGFSRSCPCLLAAAAVRRPRRARAGQPAAGDPPRWRPRLRRCRPDPPAADVVESKADSANARGAARPAARPPLPALRAHRRPHRPSPSSPADGLRRAGPRPAIWTGSCSPSRPRPTCRRSPAASPTAPARSPARGTTTTRPVCNSTTTVGTASEPVAPAAPSMTSGRSSTASTPKATSSSPSVSASPRSFCHPGQCPIRNVVGPRRFRRDSLLDQLNPPRLPALPLRDHVPAPGCPCSGLGGPAA